MYHIIFVVKYRKKLLKKYGDDIKQFVFEIANKSDFDIQESEYGSYILNLKNNSGKIKPFGVMGIFIALLVMLLLKQ